MLIGEKRRRRRAFFKRVGGIFMILILMITTNPKTKINLGRIKSDFFFSVCVWLACVRRNSSPVSRAMFLNVRNKDDVFFRSPWPFFHTNFFTTRWSSHVRKFGDQIFFFSFQVSNWEKRFSEIFFSFFSEDGWRINCVLIGDKSLTEGDECKRIYRGYI